MVSYLLVERVCAFNGNQSLRFAHSRDKNAPESAGYVTSGFWAGITIGRLVWGLCTPKYASSSLSLQIYLSWLLDFLMRNVNG